MFLARSSSILADTQRSFTRSMSQPGCWIDSRSRTANHKGMLDLYLYPHRKLSGVHIEAISATVPQRSWLLGRIDCRLGIHVELGEKGLNRQRNAVPLLCWITLRFEDLHSQPINVANLIELQPRPSRHHQISERHHEVLRSSCIGHGFCCICFACSGLSPLS